MSDWLHRHLQLTREERLLLAAIVLIVICGLITWKIRSNAGPPELSHPASGATQENTGHPPH